jgi:tetratricopeptide (TPR) repeat protein
LNDEGKENEVKRRTGMRRTWNLSLQTAAMAGLLLCLVGTVLAQTGRSSQSGQGSQSPPPAQPADKSKSPDVAPLTLDVAPPVNAEEDAAFKTFQAMAQNDANKKIDAGEAFLQKYPDSRYKTAVYGPLIYAYVQVGQVQKMQEYGEKELALAPNDVSTLALLAQTLPRSIRTDTPPKDKEQMLAKAEQYSKQAIEITPTLSKPPNLTDAAFESIKNQTLAMSHSGLGLVYVRRGKAAEAITELETAVKIDPNPDPVNYYLLGMANKSASHFDDAIAAFNKCVTMGDLPNGPCKAQADDTKKKSTTELSAPK